MKERRKEIDLIIKAFNMDMEEEIINATKINNNMHVIKL